MLRYTPAAVGTWLAAANGGRALVVASTDGAIADRLWAAVDTAVDLQGVLDILTSEGLSSTPSFAAIEWSGDLAAGSGTVHLIVRGGVSVDVVTDGSTVTTDGAEVSTWVERTLTAASDFTLVAGDSAESATLAIESGVVWASRLARSDLMATERAAPAVAAQSFAAPSIAEATVSEVTIAGPVSEAVDDELVDQTVVRPSRVPVEVPVDVPEQTLPPLVGDHDGMTIMSDGIAGLSSRERQPAAPVAPAPVGYLLELSTGGREPLTDSVLIGRAPSVSKISGGRLPKLVTIPGDQDISRNHAQFTLEGDTVVVTDLHSRNGTTIILPGKSPQLLRQGEPTSVIVGTVVDLGGGVTINVVHA